MMTRSLILYGCLFLSVQAFAMTATLKVKWQKPVEGLNAITVSQDGTRVFVNGSGLLLDFQGTVLKKGLASGWMTGDGKRIIGYQGIQTVDGVSLAKQSFSVTEQSYPVFSPNGSTVALVAASELSDDHPGVDVYDGQTGARRFSFHPAGIRGGTAVAFVDEQTLLVMVAGKLCALDSMTGKIVREIKFHEGGCPGYSELKVGLDGSITYGNHWIGKLWHFGSDFSLKWKKDDYQNVQCLTVTEKSVMAKGKFPREEKRGMLGFAKETGEGIWKGAGWQVSTPPQAGGHENLVAFVGFIPGVDVVTRESTTYKGPDGRERTTALPPLASLYLIDGLTGQVLAKYATALHSGHRFPLGWGTVSGNVQDMYLGVGTEIWSFEVRWQDQP